MDSSLKWLQWGSSAPCSLPSLPIALGLSNIPDPDCLSLQEHGLLRKGTVLLADNVIFPGAPDFLAYVRGSSSFECTHYSSHLEYMNMVDGLEKAIYKGPSSPEMS